MYRRFGAALIGLALILPIFGAAAAPVGAHGSNAFTWEAGLITDVDGTRVVGVLTNHTNSRYANVVVTATWRDGDAVVATEAGFAMVTNLAPHASSPFIVFEDDTTIEPEYDLSIDIAGAVTGIRPAGGLEVELGEFTDTDVYEGTVTNEGPVTAQNVVVYANRHDGMVYTGAAGSDVIASLAPGASATYTITFGEESLGDTVLNHIAKTNAGTFLTSWNNYFGDLGSSGFYDAIAWMADEGITLGCGNASFCPKSTVTRAQVAVFLDRALDLPDATDQGFTDLAGQSPEFEQAINNLAAAGITQGCSSTPKKFCPTSSVTRGQMSVFIVVGFRDWGGKTIDLVTNPTPDPFVDDDGQFHEDYNNGMYEYGITGGCGADRYCPNSPILREQMAVFMLRASQLEDAS